MPLVSLPMLGAPVIPHDRKSGGRLTIQSEFRPAGDQPQAIEQLVAGVAAARAEGFAVMGTLGILDLAARRDLTDLATAFARLRRQAFTAVRKFWMMCLAAMNVTELQDERINHTRIEVLTEALTTDRHFDQAGFRALLSPT